MGFVQSRGRVVIVLGCGKAKLDHAAPAGELYTGSLFRMGKRYAEAWGAPWAILSAKHGLLWPGQVIEPYDERVSLKGAALERWAASAAQKLLDSREGRKLGSKWVVVELLMGSDYAGPLGRALDRHGVSWCAPLTGMGTGHRLQWLKARAELGAAERAKGGKKRR